MKKHLSIVLGICLLFIQCSKSDDAKLPDPIDPPGKLETNVTIQNFMWQTMYAYYFWQADVPDLRDNRFSSTEDYIAYLEKHPDPEDFFYQICYNHSEVVGEANAIDRFSFSSDNYKELTKAFAGVSKSNGLQFGLSYFADSNDIFGFVYYVVPHSNAASKDIKRGDFFTGVNGITLNESNYAELLFGKNDTYILNMAEINKDIISNTGREVSLTKEPDLTENPIFIHDILEVGGQKIGYLMYNSFTNEFDEELNDVFGDFKAGGITDLVLDLRYNPGGSVNSAQLLSSMIYGPFTNEVFLKARYNQKLQADFNDADLITYFADKTYANTPLNTLGLHRVYILATENSASASELVINGLRPYIDVIQIGTQTTGKNEFSVTFVDDPENGNVYDPRRENKINPKNHWALQPLIGRNENAAGFSDYTDGLMPSILLREDLNNLGELGKINEPLLAKAIAEITGVAAKMDFTVDMPAHILTNSKMFTLTRDNMYMDIKKPAILSPNP